MRKAGIDLAHVIAQLQAVAVILRALTRTDVGGEVDAAVEGAAVCVDDALARSTALSERSDQPEE
jgi:hypothetical protein